MTRPITLSEQAFRALRAQKRDGESDSDVVLRLIEAGVQKKDPMIFFKVKLKPAFGSWKKYDAWRRKMNEADRRKAARRWREMVEG